MNLKGERDLQSLKNLNVLIITKLHMISCCQLFIISMKKCSTESQDGRNFGSSRAIRNLHSCYNFALVLHEKCTRFQPMRRALFFSGILFIKKPERDERYLSAVNFHNQRPPSISTSKIPHVAEDRDWFGVQTEGNKFTDIRSIKNNDLIVLM